MLQKPENFRQARQFGLLIAGIGGALWVRHGVLTGNGSWVGFLALSGILTCAIACPRRLELPRKVWIRLGDVIGGAMQPLILGTIFFGILSPIGLWRRATGRSRIFPSPSEGQGLWIPSDGKTGEMRKQF